MPTSSREGKGWLLPRIVAELPGTVLDVGAGEGTYAWLLAEHAAEIEGSHLIAMEAYEPYVERYALVDIYDEVIVGDARTHDFPEVDVVILGDVVEHLEHDDAVEVWEKARRAARKAVFASIPLGACPQGAVNGNEHETHRYSWTNESIHAGLPGIVASWTGREIGTYAVLPL